MKIGDAGEAFFVVETEEDIPEDLVTSPLLTATSTPDDAPLTPKTATRLSVEAMQDPDFLDLDATSQDSRPRRPRPQSYSASPSPDPSEAGPHVQYKDGLLSVHLLSFSHRPSDVALDMAGYHSQIPASTTRSHQRTASSLERPSKSQSTRERPLSFAVYSLDPRYRPQKPHATPIPVCRTRPLI